MSIWTTHNDIDILNLAGARHGDYILVKTGNKVLTKFQMPYVPRGEKISHPDPASTGGDSHCSYESYVDR